MGESEAGGLECSGHSHLTRPLSTDFRLGSDPLSSVEQRKVNGDVDGEVSLPSPGSGMDSSGTQPSFKTANKAHGFFRDTFNLTYTSTLNHIFSHG